MVGFLNTYFQLLQIIGIIHITNKCNQKVICLSFIPCVRHIMCNIQTPIENWTHVYMNLFTRNNPYYHLLKYLLFLLKHPVYCVLMVKIKTIYYILYGTRCKAHT